MLSVQMGSWTPIKYSEGVTWPKGTFWCVRASQKVLSGFSIHLMEKFSKLFGQPNTWSRNPSIPPLPLFHWYRRHWYSNVQLIDLDTADVAYSESCWAPGHAWRYGSHTTPNCLQHRKIFASSPPWGCLDTSWDQARVASWWTWPSEDHTS